MHTRTQDSAGTASSFPVCAYVFCALNLIRCEVSYVGPGSALTRLAGALGSRDSLFTPRRRRW